MKALILDGKVVQVEEEMFPVCDAMIWVDCDDEVKAGYTYDGEFHQPAEPDQTSTVQSQISALEAKVTQRRLREAVLTPEGATWLTDIENQIATLREGL